MPETLLSVLPSSDSRQRLVVVLRQIAGGSQLELQQQSWGDGVGWFTQTRLPVEREQLPLLRSALGRSGTLATPQTPPQQTLPFPSLEPSDSDQADIA